MASINPRLTKFQRNFAAKHLMNAAYGLLAATVFRDVGFGFSKPLLFVFGLVVYAVAFSTALKLKQEVQ